MKHSLNCKKILVGVASIILVSSPFFCQTTHYPIQFSIPKEKIVKQIPPKDRDFAFINPYDPTTYIYDSEETYYRDYQRSYFGITCRKSGWDCLRHYEILANGCIPYFVDLDQCHPLTMAFLPKELIKEAMQLPGVCYETMTIDHSVFDHARYYEILNALLEHTRNYLSSEKMAEYILRTANYTGEKPILFLSLIPSVNYLRCLTLIGLKQLLGNKVIDFPKIEHIYKNYPGDTKRLYGKGFSYSKIVEDEPVDRSNIEVMLKNKEFELVIYGSLHQGLLFQDLVLTNYPNEKIFYICGEDRHECVAIPPIVNLFIREYNCSRSSK